VRLHFEENSHLGKIAEPRFFSKERSASPSRSLRHFNKVRTASPLWCSRLSNEWKSHFYFRRGPRLLGNMTFASTRHVFSLYFSNKFNSTLAKIDDYFSLFNSTPTTSSEHRGGLDYVSRDSWWSSLVASKSLTVYSRRPRSRQDRAQDISKDSQSNFESLLPEEKSKVFRNPSQSTAEFWKL